MKKSSLPDQLNGLLQIAFAIFIIIVIFWFSKDIKQFEKYYKMIKENDLIAIFVLAFIPNPLFDVAGLAAGSLKIPITRFLFATVLGRILRYVLLAHVGAFSFEYI